MIDRKHFFTVFLLLMTAGYLAALVNLYLKYHRVDGRNLLTPQDLVLHFHGDESTSRLQMMINGPMEQFLKSDDEKTVLEVWCLDGSPRDTYPEVAEILELRCISCHDEFGNASFSPLTSYEEAVRHSKPFTGITWDRLARLSHQHLFGMGFIFFCLGVLSLQLGNISRFQWLILTAGSVFVLLDIGGWWLTRLFPEGAWLVVLSGAGHALCFGILILSAMMKIWGKPGSATS